MLKARNLLREGFGFRLGSDDTSLWISNCSGIGAIVIAVPFVHISDTAHCLRDVIGNGGWDFSSLSTSIPTNLSKLCWPLSQFWIHAVMLFGYGVCTTLVSIVRILHIAGSTSPILVILEVMIGHGFGS